MLTASAAVLAQPVSSGASGGFEVYSPSDKDYASKVDFVVACTVAHVLPDDPIVYPGQPGKSHSHTFGGNVSTDAYSTADTLLAQPTNCKMSRDRAAYWMPTLYNNGAEVRPYEVRAYYRAGTYNGASVQAVPFGLRMLAGNSMATTPQSANIAGFQCRNTSGNSVAKQSTPPRCDTGDYLEASVVFPNCWDGVHLDSADHRSHMAYADATAPCPADHPVRLPQLTLAQRYPIDGERGTVTLAAMTGMPATGMTLHADFLDAWDAPTMQALVDKCIHKNIACEDISDHRLPPGMTLPPQGTPTPTTSTTSSTSSTSSTSTSTSSTSPPSTTGPAGPTTTSTSTTNPTTTTSTLDGSKTTSGAAADAYVDASMSNMNMGDDEVLRVDASPATRSLLRFTGMATGHKATLRVWADSSSSGLVVSGPVDNAWTEAKVTAANAPAVTSGVPVSGTIRGGRWISIDVTALVHGPSVTLALSSTNSTRLEMSSREGAHPPQLVIG